MTQFLNKLPFAHHAWFMYIRLLVRHFLDDNCTQKAASLTYTTLLSLVPILTVMLVVFSSVPALEDVRGQVQQAVYSNLMPSSGATISQHIDSFAEKSSNLGIVGVGGVFVTTILTLITIETAFNEIWRVSERTGGVASVVRYWMMITVAPIILGVAFGASSAISGLSFLNQQIAGYGIDWGIWAKIISFLFTVGGFIAMYWFIPKVKVPLKNTVIAGAVVAILFETLKMVFGTVMTNFTSYEAIYGAFAAIPVFLMWLYLSWNLILLGVEISYTLTIFDSKEVAVRHPLLSLLDMLNLIYKKYQVGETTSEAELRNILGRKETPKWSLYIDELVTNELITRTENDEYILRTDLNTVSLWQFYKIMPYPLPIKSEMNDFTMVDYDPWCIELYRHLESIEKLAKDELDMTLSELFKTAPLRTKESVVRMTAQTTNNNSDANGFDADAKKVVDEHGNAVVVPMGEASFTESNITKAIRLAKKGWHWYGRGKKVVKDVKKGVKS